MKSLLVAAAASVAGLVIASAFGQAPRLNPDTIPDTEYVTVKDGHLSVNGQRQRYWSAIGRPHLEAGVKPADDEATRKQKLENARKGTDAIVQRMLDLGFNSVRYWRSVNTGEDYTINDGSAADSYDYFVYRAKQAGMKLWAAGLNNTGDARPTDVKIINDPATEKEWADAVKTMCTVDKDGAITAGWNVRNNVARFWDPRIEALGIDRMTKAATHYNHHTGLRWCDDPVFGVWELSNEEWWMRKMVGGQWQKLPPFFRNSLVAKWNEFLKNKYKTNDAVKQAWGKLLQGESLEAGSILLAPMAGKSSAAVSINDASAVARAAVESLEQTYERKDFSEQRGADVLEFFVGMQVAHKQREAAAIKPLGKSTRLSPMIFDTGIGYEIQSQFLHQNADAVAHDAYVNGVGPAYEDRIKALEGVSDPQKQAYIHLEAERIAANSGRWVNWLLKPPMISQGVPWLEHNRVEGKPYFVYETQIQQPAKYRSDFPLRLAAIAAIQDWDWVCWHYFQPPDDVATKPQPFVRPMDITTGGHPQGYHFTYDEVQTSAMRAAGYMFRSFNLKPAPSPTKFTFGRKALYDPRSMDYGMSYGMLGMDMIHTVYQHGVRIKIDPTREDDVVEGPVVKFADRNTHNPYAANNEITFDHKKGFLKFDAPGAVAFTGLLANYGDKVEFSNGLSLTNVSINNPEGIFEPIGDNEKFITFALTSQDGKPLARTKSAMLSLVSTSFNTGFYHGTSPKDPNRAGTLPVLVARVGATIKSSDLIGMNYTFRDWSMAVIDQGQITGDSLVVPADKPIFFVELSR